VSEGLLLAAGSWQLLQAWAALVQELTACSCMCINAWYMISGRL
jgi:hypothetical protein